MLICPWCGGALESALEAPPDAAHQTARDELNAVRIARLAAHRQSVARSRSFTVSAAVVTGIIAMQLAWLGVRRGWRGTWDAGAVVLMLIAAILAAGTAIMAWRSHRMKQSLQTDLPPQQPSDEALEQLGTGPASDKPGG